MTPDDITAIVEEEMANSGHAFQFERQLAAVITFAIETRLAPVVARVEALEQQIKALEARQ